MYYGVLADSNQGFDFFPLKIRKKLPNLQLRFNMKNVGGLTKV